MTTNLLRYGISGCEIRSQSDDEVRALREMVQRLEAENERLRNLVAASAPLTWVLTEDADGAKAWESWALEVLDD